VLSGFIRILTILPVSPIYFFTRTRYFVYPCGTEWKSLIFRISQNLSYFFGGFENGLNVVLIQYPVDMVYCSFYRRMEKVLLLVSSCDGCVLGFIVLLVCLLIILFISFLSCPFFCKACFRWLSSVCKCFLSEMIKALCISESIADRFCAG